MQVRLTWSDPIDRARRQAQVETPFAIGRDVSAMPPMYEGGHVAPVILDSPQIAPYHALVYVRDDRLMVFTPDIGSPVNINGMAAGAGVLADGDRLQVGPYELETHVVSGSGLSAAPDGTPAGSFGARPAPIIQSAPPIPPPYSGPAAGGLPTASGGIPTSSTDGTCNRKIGFLFSRRCGRLSPIGCPYCDGGTLMDDPYFYASERSYYIGYGNYYSGDWGGDYYPDNGAPPDGVDFTEADAGSLASAGDIAGNVAGFEQDMGES